MLPEARYMLLADFMMFPYMFLLTATRFGTDISDRSRDRVARRSATGMSEAKQRDKSWVVRGQSRVVASLCSVGFFVS